MPPQVLLGLWLLAAVARASSSGSGVAPDKPITSIGGYWNVPDVERGRPLPIDLKLTVYYYDPYWHLLWGGEDGAVGYLPTRPPALPIKSGELVRVRGTVVPEAGLDARTLDVQVLSADAVPKPIAADGRIGQAESLNARWVRVDGYVCSQSESDGSHLQLNILADGRMVTTRVLVASDETVPLLLDARVRVKGVYVASRDSSGRYQGISLWVPGPREIAKLGSMADDPRFALPRTPILRIASAPQGAWVHISGEVRGRETARSVTLRDDSGQVTIDSEQPGPIQIGDFVEAIGRRTGEGIRTTLGDPVFRIVPRGAGSGQSASGGPGQPAGELRLAEQVMDLPPEKAAEGHPVVLQGVVTWSNPAADFFYLQDSSGGVAVSYPDRAKIPQGGMLGAGVGASALGPAAPEVRASRLTTLGATDLPVPDQVTLEQALTGTEESRCVEMSGYVRQATLEGKWLRLDLTTSTGEFSAYLAPSSGVPRLAGALVRVTGVCSTIAASQHRVAGIRLWLPGADAIQVEEPAPANPFDAPRRTIAGLRQFMAFHRIESRERISGVVLKAVPGSYFYLQDHDAGLLVYTFDPRRLSPGEEVEAVGLPGRDDSRLVLRDAVGRRMGTGVLPVPLRLGDPNRVIPDADGRLVRVEARLNEIIPDPNFWRLEFQAGRTLFEARLDRVGRRQPPAPGSLV